MGIKLSISNIAWEMKDDHKIYEYLQNKKIEGIEIAPSRIFGATPYENLEVVKQFKKDINEKYNLKISSLQSIWFGRRENLFSSDEDRDILKNYTQKAILFAEAIGANNLVFGCPKNRNINSRLDKELAIPFFRELGDYAHCHNTILSIEANPVIYGTNYINYTQEAIDLVNQVESKGFMLNLDFGTIIENREDIENIQQNLELVNHIHISEPHLNIIKVRKEHSKLIDILKKADYDGYVSIEMKKQEDISKVYSAIEYIINIIRER